MPILSHDLQNCISICLFSQLDNDCYKPNILNSIFPQICLIYSLTYFFLQRVISFYFMGVGILLYGKLCTACVQCLWRPKEGVIVWN